jgi:hypothetical protein
MIEREFRKRIIFKNTPSIYAEHISKLLCYKFKLNDIIKKYFVTLWKSGHRIITDGNQSTCEIKTTILKHYVCVSNIFLKYVSSYEIKFDKWNKKHHIIFQQMCCLDTNAVIETRFVIYQNSSTRLSIVQVSNFHARIYLDYEYELNMHQNEQNYTDYILNDYIFNFLFMNGGIKQIYTLINKSFSTIKPINVHMSDIEKLDKYLPQHKKKYYKERHHIKSVSLLKLKQIVNEESLIFAPKVDGICGILYLSKVEYGLWKIVSYFDDMVEDSIGIYIKGSLNFQNELKFQCERVRNCIIITDLCTVDNVDVLRTKSTFTEFIQIYLRNILKNTIIPSKYMFTTQSYFTNTLQIIFETNSTDGIIVITFDKFEIIQQLYRIKWFNSVELLYTNNIFCDFNGYSYYIKNQFISIEMIQDRIYECLIDTDSVGMFYVKQILKVRTDRDYANDRVKIYQQLNSQKENENFISFKNISKD